MVLPSTRHAAFDKAAHYFGVEKRVIPVGADFRADLAATEAALDDDVVLVVGSAPSYAHGVIDPIPELAALAAARGIRCHVDSCIGGWVLPYAARLGRDVPPWTFAVDGVTSISVDLHKYGYAPKGTSLLLHRTAELRRPQYFSSADWPGYTMLNSTMQSTKSGGPLAGAWAVVQSLGDDGYLTLTRQVFEAVDLIVAGVAAIPALSLVVRPDSSLVAFVDRRLVRRLHDLRRDARPRLVRPAADVVRRPGPVGPPLGERRDPGARRRVPLGAGRGGRRCSAGRADRRRPRHRVVHRVTRPGRPHRRRLRRPARGVRPGRSGRRGRARAAEAAGRGQRDARPRLPGHARGPAGHLLRPAAAAPGR